MIKKEIVYFEKPGKDNTDDCLNIVKERLRKGDIKHVVIASGRGETALKLHNKIDELDVDIIDVTYHAAMKEEKKEALEKNKPELERCSIKLVSSTHALSAGERSVAGRWQGTYPLLLIADTYRTFGEGMKVCVEVSLMAADTGNVPAGENILVIGGTSKGCDTAVVLKSAYSAELLQKLAINEILCMPFTEGIEHKAR